jgi:hypothetical protein
VPKNIKEEQLLLLIEFDAGPLAGKMQHALPIHVRGGGQQ